MMLQEQIESRTSQTAGIHAPGLFQPFPQIGAHNPFMPCLGAEGRLSPSGFGPEIQVRSKNVGLVVIERIFVRCVAEQFEPVLSVVPVQGGREVQCTFPF